MNTVLVKFSFRDSELFFRKEAMDYLDYSEVEYIKDADSGEILYKS